MFWSAVSAVTIFLAPLLHLYSSSSAHQVDPQRNAEHMERLGRFMKVYMKLDCKEWCDCTEDMRWSQRLHVDECLVKLASPVQTYKQIAELVLNKTHGHDYMPVMLDHIKNFEAMSERCYNEDTGECPRRMANTAGQRYTRSLRRIVHWLGLYDDEMEPIGEALDQCLKNDPLAHAEMKAGFWWMKACVYQKEENKTGKAITDPSYAVGLLNLDQDQEKK